MTKVLVVDDEDVTLSLINILLELSGYEVYTTLNSEDAVTLAEAVRPDCILLDIMMPVMDGFQVCKLMRASEITRETPIVFVTAYSPLDLDDRRREAGADSVVMKPFSMDGLIASIEERVSVQFRRELDRMVLAAAA